MLSFIITLNNSYDGGGTYIHDLRKALKPNVAGGMISFCGGELLHGGSPVVQGTRYVIVAFLYVDYNSDKGNNENEERQSVAPSTGFSFGFAL